MRFYWDLSKSNNEQDESYERHSKKDKSHYYREYRKQFITEALIIIFHYIYLDILKIRKGLRCHWEINNK
jgi:hypothetical protein